MGMLPYTFIFSVNVIMEIQCDKYDVPAAQREPQEGLVHFEKAGKKICSSSFLFDIPLFFLSVNLCLSRFYLSIAPYSIAPFSHISVLCSLWLQPVSYPPSSNQTQTANHRPRYPGPQVFCYPRAALRAPAHLPLLSNHSTPLTFTFPLTPCCQLIDR